MKCIYQSGEQYVWIFEYAGQIAITRLPSDKECFTDWANIIFKGVID